MVDQPFPAKKVSKYVVISGPYFPACRPEITPYLDTFHAVMESIIGRMKINKDITYKGISNNWEWEPVKCRDDLHAEMIALMSLLVDSIIKIKR